ncbi:hypothetical protein AZE42_08456 [Rhizopogon vesiculosus]|uniref:Uncharacterized protein n=1 Tax=Rhizopogon vesiculosus TaxID=180088 RepID=A0A1J8PS55_9AGAM|nr:hypothetical protein AZE42_08456 [Rhizopogon vesiculosus]
MFEQTPASHYNGGRIGGWQVC